MKWELVEQQETTAEEIYEVLKQHCLLPASTTLAASVCTSMAAGGSHFTICDQEGELVANVFLSGIVEGESAQLDFVPVVRHFRTGFDNALRSAMLPLLDLLFSSLRVRRITSAFPETRSRTKRALCSLGFKPEGRIREGVALYNQQPEDIRILGLLRAEHFEEPREDEGKTRPSTDRGLVKDIGMDRGFHDSNSPPAP